MPKQKSIEDNELIRLLDEYRLNNPNIKVTIPAFGTYIRSRGYDVQDHTIRRRTGFRKYLETVNQGSEEVIYSDLVTYQTLDADAFLSEHRTRESLKEALDTMRGSLLMQPRRFPPERRPKKGCRSWKYTVLSWKNTGARFRERLSTPNSSRKNRLSSR